MWQAVLVVTDWYISLTCIELFRDHHALAVVRWWDTLKEFEVFERSGTPGTLVLPYPGSAFMLQLDLFNSEVKIGTERREILRPPITIS
jgi:hypothetical protein